MIQTIRTNTMPKMQPEDLTDNGRCTGCGSCCSSVLPLTEKDIRRIRHYIAKHGIKEQAHITAPMANTDMDLTCPFLNSGAADKKCTVYPVRPAICRSFTCRSVSDPAVFEKCVYAYRAALSGQDPVAQDMRVVFFKKEGHI